jgi:GNAT superfamily N-acetyltransferase
MLAGGLELDDDRDRIDVDAARVVGLYDGPEQVGFARVISDGVRSSHLCDVYVLEPYRGRGLGVELVREAVDNSPHAKLAWTLATRDAYGLYERFGFSKPRERYMERPAAR